MGLLKWAIILAIIAGVFALFGFTGIAEGFADIAKVLFAVFLVLVVVFIVLGAFVFKSVT